MCVYIYIYIYISKGSAMDISASLSNITAKTLQKNIQIIYL